MTSITDKDELQKVVLSKKRVTMVVPMDDNRYKTYTEIVELLKKAAAVKEEDQLSVVLALNAAIVDVGFDNALLTVAAAIEMHGKPQSRFAKAGYSNRQQ